MVQFIITVQFIMMALGLSSELAVVICDVHLFYLLAVFY